MLYIVKMPVHPLILTISTWFLSPPAQLKSITLFRSGPSSECLINFIPPQPASTFFLRGFSNLLLPSSVSLLLTSSTCLFLYLLSHSSGSVCLDISDSQNSHTKDPHWLQTNIYHFNTESHHGTSGCSPVPVSCILTDYTNARLSLINMLFVSGSTTAALIWILHTTTQLLSDHDYVIIIELDFCKAFDTVRHSTLFDKFADLEIPDNIYNWLVEFFQGHSHCTRYGHRTSAVREISASIVQGSAIGPATLLLLATYQLLSLVIYYASMLTIHT